MCCRVRSESVVCPKSPTTDTTIGLVDVDDEDDDDASLLEPLLEPLLLLLLSEVVVVLVLPSTTAEGKAPATGAVVNEPAKVPLMT